MTQKLRKVVFGKESFKQQNTRAYDLILKCYISAFWRLSPLSAKQSHIHPEFKTGIVKENQGREQILL